MEQQHQAAYVPQSLNRIPIDPELDSTEKDPPTIPFSGAHQDDQAWLSSPKNATFLAPTDFHPHYQHVSATSYPTTDTGPSPRSPYHHAQRPGPLTHPLILLWANGPPNTSLLGAPLSSFISSSTFKMPTITAMQDDMTTLPASPSGGPTRAHRHSSCLSAMM